jgi:predicted nucleic acid-binding protein
MKIVSDTGPIIGLAKIGKIILLKNIADEVIIPPMVYKELFGKTGLVPETLTPETFYCSTNTDKINYWSTTR